MNSKNLLIVFVKNAVLGHAKTRLAKTIGNEAAFEVYKHLLQITEDATNQVSDCDVHVYFSSEKTADRWGNHQQFVQTPGDLGVRMGTAFKHGFESGYERIVGVGSDLPDLTSAVISDGIKALTTSDTVFGPSDDGGYYLIGMNKFYPFIFNEKPWSTTTLLNETLSELKEKHHSTTLLSVLNDIDTIEDLQVSSIAHKFEHLWLTKE